jgi:hypothetical protein
MPKKKSDLGKDPRTGKSWTSVSQREIYEAGQRANRSSPQPTRAQYDAAVARKAQEDLQRGAIAYGAMFTPPALPRPQATAGASTDPAEDKMPQGWTLDDLLALDSEDGGGGGVNLGGLLASIADAYTTRLAELDRQKGEGEGIINDSSAKAQADIKARQADNTTQQDALNARIQQQYADALARRQAENQALTAELSKFGVDPARLMPGTMGGNAAMEQMRSAQSDLQTRMGQIANDSMSARAATSDLIAQGARGQLANGYAAMRMQMDLQRQQQEAEARQQAASAGRSSGGGSALDRLSKAVTVKEKLDKLNGDETKDASPYDMEMLKPGSGAYAAAVNGGKPDDVLRKYFTVTAYDDEGNKREEFDYNGYDAAYRDLENARASRAALNAQGYSPQRASLRLAASGYGNVLSKLSFNGR